MERIPTAQDWNDWSLASANAYDLAHERARWNEIAPGYAGKRRSGGYLAQFLARLQLEPSDTVLDMGCGPGVLTVPLAQAGHEVCAVDFSDGMLSQLKAAVDAAGVGPQVQAFRRAWQEPWEGIPICDVAVASRSLTTANIADAVAKLESKARKRVVVSVAAGEIPWCDLRIWRALGREIDHAALARDLVVLTNYLFALGRLPQVEYLVSARAHESRDEAELKSFLRRCAAPQNAHEEELLEAFLSQHIVPCEDGGARTDYKQETCWAVVSWKMPASA